MFGYIRSLFSGSRSNSIRAALHQDLRETSLAISAARTALVVANGQDRWDAANFETLGAHIADVESHALLALEQGMRCSAYKAVTVLTHLVTERAAVEDRQSSLAIEIDLLRRWTARCDSRLWALKRSSHKSMPTLLAQQINSAEVLAGLRVRSSQLDATAAVLGEMERASDFDGLGGRLAELGCAAPLKANADVLLARLQSRVVMAA